MLKYLLLRKDIKKLAELSELESISRAEATHKVEEIRREVTERTGVLQTLALSASLGCVAGWIANNKETVAQLRDLPVDDLLQLVNTYQAVASQHPAGASDVGEPSGSGL